MRYLSFLTLFFIVLISCSKDPIINPDYYNTNHRYIDTAQIVNSDTLFFTQIEKDTIFIGDTSDIMRVLKITNYDDSLLLRTICRNVKPDSSDTALFHLIKRMYYTVKHPTINGIGIAAPQVGILRNIIWVQRKDKAGQPFEVYLNPVIIQTTMIKGTGTDGCLSIPSTQTSITSRYKAIEIEYDLPDGSHHIELVEGLTARIFQHEIDHLKGILYIDYLNN